MVKMCIKESICDRFTDYSETNVYHKSTKNRNFLLEVPKVRLEFSKRFVRKCC